MSSPSRHLISIGGAILAIVIAVLAVLNYKAMDQLDQRALDFRAELENKAFDKAERTLTGLKRTPVVGPAVKARKKKLVEILGRELNQAHDGFYRELGEQLIREAEEFAGWHQFEQADRIVSNQLSEIVLRDEEAQKSFTGRVAYARERIDELRERSLRIEPLPEEPVASNPRFQELWAKIRPRLNQVDRLLVEKDEAPKSAILRKDQKDLSKDINKLLDEVGEHIFEGSELLEVKERYWKVQQSIRDKRNRISAIREQIDEAPEDAIFAKTREELEAEQKKLEGEMKDLKKNLPEITRDMKRYLRSLGMELSDEQVGIFFNRVDADDLIGLMAIFQVLRPMHDQLGGLIKENEDNLDYARKYYGMHMTLLQMILRFQEAYINEIEEVHLPALMELKKKAEATREEAREKMDLESADTGGERLKAYEANIKSLDLTIQSVELYRDVLIRQQKTVELARGKITKDFALAENTYNTVKISSSLLDLINETQTTFLALSSLQLPEIVVFENTALQKKFAELSESMR